VIALEERREERAIPLTILTGFLGAGKTTLLARILNGDHGLRVAVLVNDFGAINIDAELVARVESDVISLSNGCVCCTIRGDLVEAVGRAIDLPERPEYVLLEASGVADPAAIVATFADPGLDERIRLDGITCVVDAEQVFAAPEQMRLKLWQIGCADLLILNKVDLVSRDQIEKIEAWLDEHFHRLRVIEASHCDVPLEILLSAGRFDASGIDIPTRCAGPHSHEPRCGHRSAGHAASFDTWSFENDRPLSLEALAAAARRLPPEVYRCKGIVRSVESPDHRAVLQVVGKRVAITLGGAWGDRVPATRIVAIGAAAGMNYGSLRDLFDACIAG